MCRNMRTRILEIVDSLHYCHIDKVRFVDPSIPFLKSTISSFVLLTLNARLLFWHHSIRFWIYLLYSDSSLHVICPKMAGKLKDVVGAVSGYTVVWYRESRAGGWAHVWSAPVLMFIKEEVLLPIRTICGLQWGSWGSSYIAISRDPFLRVWWCLEEMMVLNAKV